MRLRSRWRARTGGRRARAVPARCYRPGMNLRRRGRRVLAAVVAAVLVAAAVVAGLVVASRPAPIGVRNLRIAVTDGPRDNQHVLLDATFFTPAGRGKVPAILVAHGFGQTKNAVRPEAEQLARAGFAVLTWSARGFGQSTGQIALDSPDYEVKDVEQLVSWLARQPRVLLDHPGDPRVGITGASYGGGDRAAGRRLRPPDRRHRPADHLEQPGHRALPERGGRRAARRRVQEAVGRPAVHPGLGGLRCRQPGCGQPTGYGQPVRPLPAPDLRHLPAGRHPGAAHAAGRLAAAAVQPGQRREPDRRPDAADPGHARLAVRAGPGQRQLPGHPAKRGTRGHGLVRRRRTTAAIRRPAG